MTLPKALIGAPDAAPVLLVDWLAGGQPGQLLTGRSNLAKVERNLRQRLPAAPPLWRDFVVRSGIRVVLGKAARCAGINTKDAEMVATALRCSATHFVTGDKRLLAEMKRAELPTAVAVTPREMLDLLLAL